MDFGPSPDLQTFLEVLDQHLRSPEAGWAVSPDHARYQWAGGLDALLDANGFFDAAAEPTLGPLAAANMVYRIARLPVLVEAGASAVLRGAVMPGLPRPIAVTGPGARTPTRFLPLARSVIRLGDDEVSFATLDAGDVETVESSFAYPMGRLLREPDWKRSGADPDAARNLWRVALAAEIGGALVGGLDAVLAHVRERRQFGRPIGSFQAVQHRLAGAATRIEGIYWLTMRAAGNAWPADAALALGYAQEQSGAIVYDLHQFMGAMGLTLEHPLHRWTYRVRLLRAALGGASANLQLAAVRTWEAA